MDTVAIQSFLNEHDLDGWLLADFHGRNHIAVAIIDPPGPLMRRSFLYIPAEGRPVAIVQALEKSRYEHLDADLVVCIGYKELEAALKKTLGTGRRIAMEYSANGRLPYVSLVDAGTVEYVRDLGNEIVSSGDLVASFEARLSVEQIASHRMAARNLIEIKDKAFRFIAERVGSGKELCEYDVVSFVQSCFDDYDMETAFGPNCSVGANAGNPHYEPAPDGSAAIGRGRIVLLDLWAKLNTPRAVYGDITWMAFTGAKSEVPSAAAEMFGIIAKARDAAVGFLRENIDRRPVFGWEVDDVCRKVITAAGYGEQFIHRTGHSITTSEHGPGPNIDNLETEDQRRLQKGHLFSIEPGIYTAEIGLRTEIDALISHEGLEVTTLPLQTEIVPLF